MPATGASETSAAMLIYPRPPDSVTPLTSPKGTKNLVRSSQPILEQLSRFMSPDVSAPPERNSAHATRSLVFFGKEHYRHRAVEIHFPPGLLANRLVLPLEHASIPGHVRVSPPRAHWFRRKSLNTNANRRRRAHVKVFAVWNRSKSSRFDFVGMSKRANK